MYSTSALLYTLNPDSYECLIQLSGSNWVFFLFFVFLFFFGGWGGGVGRFNNYFFVGSPPRTSCNAETCTNMALAVERDAKTHL